MCLLTAVGTLDSSTYRRVRDRVIEAALGEPAAVLVDVNGLDGVAPSVWLAFASARWHVSTWPGIPILLVCGRPELAARIAQSGVTRHVPVHSDIEAALRSLTHDELHRRRARIELPRRLTSLRRARDFVGNRLSDWSQGQLIPAAKVVADVLVSNVLRHTQSPPVVLLENARSTVTIAVQDAEEAPAVRREAADGSTDRASGLAVVDVLCRAWGSAPTPHGKTVWAVIGPENRL